MNNKTLDKRFKGTTMATTRSFSCIGCMNLGEGVMDIHNFRHAARKSICLSVQMTASTSLLAGKYCQTSWYTGIWRRLAKLVPWTPTEEAHRLTAACLVTACHLGSPYHLRVDYNL